LDKMAEKTENVKQAEKPVKSPGDRIEREYIIPLRERVRSVPRYKKANKAIKTIKEFLAKHMKIRDRDLKKIKLDKYINEFVWARGIKKPPAKIKVKAIKEKDSGIVMVELLEFSERLKFKKAREEKRDKKAEEGAEKKKQAKPAEDAEKPKEDAETKEEEKEKLKEEKEKKAAVAEAGKEMEKAIAKQAKHKVGGKTKEPKHQTRKALAK